MRKKKYGVAVPDSVSAWSKERQGVVGFKDSLTSVTGG